ncbi:hypothetical protein [Endozoicomonas montiporae]|uniref:Holin n=1 Tax=Endozoicomonas montiporae CL-33 TaxID=570277 RepID=A0A142BD08_9GAMM|nr:hypothetical protein [Endozoicomonas montiporae]AMO56634.1 hypothetical protein EZMO1_2555 [Endozoicomonas montiporae CL-33]
MDRLKEPSTWAGIAAIASGFGWVTIAEAATLSNAIPAIISGVSALAAIFVKEKGNG